MYLDSYDPEDAIQPFSRLKANAIIMQKQFLKYIRMTDFQYRNERGIMNDHVDNSKRSGDIDSLFLARLEELGGSKLTAELVNMYLIRGDQLLDTISTGIKAQDFSAVKNAAHSLISSAGNLGGQKVSNISKRIEAAAIDEQFVDMSDLFTELSEAQVIFQQYLKETLGEL